MYDPNSNQPNFYSSYSIDIQPPQNTQNLPNFPQNIPNQYRPQMITETRLINKQNSVYAQVEETHRLVIPKPDYSKFKPILPYDDFSPESQKNLENLFCSLCGGISYDAVVDDENHLFCKNCYFLYCPHPPYFCPIENKILSFSPKSITGVDELVNKQLMLCKNRSLGCKWNGVPKAYIFHVKSDCMKIKEKCPYKNCNLLYYRDQIPMHKLKCIHRPERCMDCNEYYECCDHEKHKENCKKAKVACPQQCFAQIAKDTLVKHIKDFCPNTLIHCKLFEIGCKDIWLFCFCQTFTHFF